MAGWLWRAVGARRVLAVSSAGPSPLSHYRRHELHRRGLELDVQRGDAAQWRDDADARKALLGAGGAAAQDVGAVIVLCGVRRGRGRQRGSYARRRFSDLVLDRVFFGNPPPRRNHFSYNNFEYVFSG